MSKHANSGHARSQFLEVPEFRNVTLKCLSEIGGLQIGPEYNNKFIILFNMVMTSVNKMIPPNTDIAGAYEASADADQELILNLALFLTNFLSAHVTILETAENRDVLLNAHLYLIKISQVEEREVFKICLEYWAKLVADLYDELVKYPGGDGLGGANPLLSLGGMAGFGGGAGGAGGAGPNRRSIYTEVLSNLRLVMVERMAKPEEVRQLVAALLSRAHAAPARVGAARTCASADSPCSLSLEGAHRRERRGRDRARVPQGHGHGRPVQVDARGPGLPHPPRRRRHRDDQCVVSPPPPQL